MSDEVQTSGLGDVNGDGEVNSADALQVLQTAVGILKPVKYCDCAE